jgi:calcineurin-like phosphoesterase family protein
MIRKLTYVVDKNTNVFFTSDTHFSHKNIIKYSNRPFANQDEMDETMILRWNKKVSPRDVVFILGDVCFGPAEDIARLMSRLNGVKHLCLGNHDKEIIKNIQSFNKTVFESVSRDREISVRVGSDVYDVTLNHYAQLVWNKSHHGSLHFWGHSHGGIAGHTQGTDVGADCFNYEPASFEEVLKSLKTNKPYPDCYFPALKNDHHVTRNNKD